MPGPFSEHRVEDVPWGVCIQCDCGLRFEGAFRSYNGKSWLEMLIDNSQSEISESIY